MYITFGITSFAAYAGTVCVAYRRIEVYLVYHALRLVRSEVRLAAYNRVFIWLVLEGVGRHERIFSAVGAYVVSRALPAVQFAVRRYGVAGTPLYALAAFIA